MLCWPEPLRSSGGAAGAGEGEANYAQGREEGRAAKKAPAKRTSAKKAAPRTSARRVTDEGTIGFNADDLMQESLAMQRKQMEG